MRRLAVLAAVALALAGCGGRSPAIVAGSTASAPLRALLLNPGTAIPDALVLDLAGKRVNLSRHSGKPLVIEFFQTSCHFCHEDAPLLQAAYARHQAKGLQVVAIDPMGETPELVREFAAKHKLTHPVYRDPDRATLESFDLRYTPTLYFVDRGGRVQAHFVGVIPVEDLEGFIAGLLAQ